MRPLSECLCSIRRKAGCQPVAGGALLVALPSNHALVGERALSLRRLAGETFVVIGPANRGVYDLTTVACHAAGFSPRIGQEALASLR